MFLYAVTGPVECGPTGRDFPLLMHSSASDSDTVDTRARRAGVAHAREVDTRCEVGGDARIQVRSAVSVLRNETGLAVGAEEGRRTAEHDYAADDGTGMIALRYNTDLFNMTIEQGRWLSGSQEPEVLMNQKAMEKYHHPAGGRVKLKLAGKAVDFTVVGVVWELGGVRGGVRGTPYQLIDIISFR